MHRNDWFATPIWHEDLLVEDSVINYLSDYWINVSKKEVSTNHSNKGGWQSESKTILDLDAEKILFNEIGKRVKEVSNQLGIHYPIRLVNYWANINYKNSYNVEHIHNRSIVSGVLYLNIPNDDCGSITFSCDSTKQFILDTYTDGSTPLSKSSVSYSPKSKRLLLFPSWVTHRVENNNTDQLRISISFNFTY